jgi:hypothetical protein
MSAEKIAAFYEDTAKRETDYFSLRKAFAVRSFSIGTGMRWTALRWTKFLGQLARSISTQHLPKGAALGWRPFRHGPDIAPFGLLGKR